MGYSVRWKHGDSNWRCTVWMGWSKNQKPRYNLSEIVGLELYDHNTDDQENFNLASEKIFVDVIQKCFEFIEGYVH